MLHHVILAGCKEAGRLHFLFNSCKRSYRVSRQAIFVDTNKIRLAATCPDVVCVCALSACLPLFDWCIHAIKAVDKCKAKVQHLPSSVSVMPE